MPVVACPAWPRALPQASPPTAPELLREPEPDGGRRVSWSAERAADGADLLDPAAPREL